MGHYLTDAAQDPQEISAFCGLLQREGVRSYLEIGSKWGGSLWRVATALPPGSRIVAVDLAGDSPKAREINASVEAVIAELVRRGYDARVIWGDSTAGHVVGEATELAPFDAVLIDADHRLPGVTQDWVNYGPLGRIVAFHDIAWRRAAEWKGARIDVPEFWASIKGGYTRTQEIRHCPTGKNNGIGVLWRS